jgi:hypothetical protein
MGMSLTPCLDVSFLINPPFSEKMDAIQTGKIEIDSASLSWPAVAPTSITP